MEHKQTYSERVQRVVDHLTKQLDEPFDLEKLAGLAHLSPYHFHRIYRALLGETIHETVRRIRLHRSALDLLDRNLSIECTARRAGFASQAAFTRAFRKEYGAPPARYRDSRRAVVSAPDDGVSRYELELVDLPELHI